MDDSKRALLRQGTVIPAHPLALNGAREFDTARQRGLTRYYRDSGAGGIAVAVHTTQFAIREAGLLEPVLRLAREEWPSDRLAIAGVCGLTGQAKNEANLAKALGYDAALLSLAALREATQNEAIAHVESIAEILPVVGFYLQPAVGGSVLPYGFWERFARIPNVVAIKIAPFHRYQTLDVVRAVAASGRAHEIALYTGNDDNIINDLLTTYEFDGVRVPIVGGLLGQWAVWTRRAVEMLREIQALRVSGAPIPAKWLTLNTQLTDANAALFDAANQFHGCIVGIHEALRRQGLLDGVWCLDPNESFGPGQLSEIDRVMRAYPRLQDAA
jgi:dihydrodipicolinate synthase/N-acetylneuraminate lyase